MSFAPSVAEDVTWHRLSPRMLLVHPVIEITRALPAVAGVLLAGGTNVASAIWALAVATVVGALALTRWFTTRLRITSEQIQLRHGLLRRKTVSTSRDRIRTVDVTSHLLHRLLGLARVAIGTGTNDRKGEGRIVLDGLTLPAAARLRDDLLHRPRTDPSARYEPSAVPAARPDHSDRRELATLDRRWIGYAPFTLSGVLTGLVIWGFYWRVQGESQIDVLHSGPLRSVTGALKRMPTWSAVLIVAVALIVFVAITSTVGYVLAFWNFRLVRHSGGTLQVTRGLITTRATSIERRRLVGAAISEPLLLRAVGGARTLVIATGLRTGRGAERGGEVLLPPAPLAAAQAVATAVLDGTSAMLVPLARHGSAARRRRVTRAVFGGLVLFAAAAVTQLFAAPAWVLIVGAALLVASLPIGLDRSRNLGHALVDGYLVTQSGSIVRRRAVLGGDSVIGWNVRSTFFQRRLQLVTLTATTAAGSQGYRVLDLDVRTGLSLANELTSGLLTEFAQGASTTHRARAQS